MANKIDYAIVAFLSFIVAAGIKGFDPFPATLGAAVAILAMASVLALWGKRIALYVTFALVALATVAGA